MLGLIMEKALYFYKGLLFFQANNKILRDYFPDKYLPLK
jgi:hypothetical protein